MLKNIIALDIHLGVISIFNISKQPFTKLYERGLKQYIYGGGGGETNPEKNITLCLYATLPFDHNSS